MFGTVVPGMTQLVARQLEQLDGVRVPDSGFDGRSGVILLDVLARGEGALWTQRTLEDLFVEVGRTTRSSGDKPAWIAGRVWRSQRVECALAEWSRQVRPLGDAVTYRVIARVLQERSFLRTELRDAMSRSIGTGRPKWRAADPSVFEVWVLEYRPSRLISGVRLSDSRMRQHGGRKVERPGALRPTVAASMVSLAGPPAGTLLDPCCGSGTILGEALAVGWPVALGVDIDRAAVAAARRNAREANVAQGDARCLNLPDASVDALVSNLPFGEQYSVQGEMGAWLADVLRELARVTRPGGRLVLLAPDIPLNVLPHSLRRRGSDTIRLLGRDTRLWVYERG